MIEKIGHIRNPLSIIAIFAGIAEISGTVVLPFLNFDIQSKYVYFLMIFPSALVLMFFGTLWYKHQVLYAPSDYKDENNFARWVKFASASEVFFKKEQENKEDDEKDGVDKDIDDSNKTANSDLRTSNDKLYLKRGIAEELAFKKLSDMYPDLVRNIKLGAPDTEGIVLDGAILKGGMTFIDVRTPLSLGRSYVNITAKRFVERLKPFIPDGISKPKLLMVYVALNDHLPSNLPSTINREGDQIELIYLKYSELKKLYKYNDT